MIGRRKGASHAASGLGEARLLGTARGVDQVRTCRAEEGFGILEQHLLVLGHEVLEFLTFCNRETSLGGFVEQPVKPSLARGVESPQLA